MSERLRPLAYSRRDPLDDAARKRRWPTGRTSRLTPARRHKVIAQEALELFDGDEPLAPGQLDGIDRPDDAAVDGRDAHAERLGGLATGVGESADLSHLLDPARRGGNPRWRFVDIAPVVAPRPRRRPVNAIEVAASEQAPVRRTPSVVDRTHGSG
jgi:hypothetical protein